MSPDDYLDEDEPEGSSARSIFQSGWVRAILALGILAVVLVVSLPYLMRWIDLSPPAPSRTAVKPPEPRAAVSTTAGTAPVTMAVPAPAPAPPTPASTVPDRAESARPAGSAAPRATAAPSASVGERMTASKLAGPAAEATAPARRSAPTAETRTSKGNAEATVQTSGDYWVQVGVFQDDKNAERLAATLREAKMPVEVTRVSRGGAGGDAGGRHEVFVTGATTEAVNAALRGRGTARAVGDGVVVQPALDLKDAVALSKRLAAEGLTVKIRRVSEAAATHHVVRVGAYPTRARAEAARQELIGKGLGGFVAQGPAK